MEYMLQAQSLGVIAILLVIRSLHNIDKLKFLLYNIIVALWLFKIWR